MVCSIRENREEVLRRVINTRQNNCPVLQQLEIIREILQADFAIQYFTAKGELVPVRSLLQLAKLLTRVERFGEGEDEEHEHGRKHYGVELKDPAPA